jgi:hypothetical protein
MGGGSAGPQRDGTADPSAARPTLHGGMPATLFGAGSGTGFKPTTRPAPTKQIQVELLHFDRGMITRMNCVSFAVDNPGLLCEDWPSASCLLTPVNKSLLDTRLRGSAARGSFGNGGASREGGCTLPALKWARSHLNSDAGLDCGDLPCRAIPSDLDC